MLFFQTRYTLYSGWNNKDEIETRPSRCVPWHDTHPYWLFDPREGVRRLDHDIKVTLLSKDCKNDGVVTLRLRDDVRPRRYSYLTGQGVRQRWVYLLRCGIDLVYCESVRPRVEQTSHIKDVFLSFRLFWFLVVWGVKYKYFTITARTLNRQNRKRDPSSRHKDIPPSWQFFCFSKRRNGLTWLK